MLQQQYKNLESFKDRYNDLCPANIQCKNPNCQKIHPRCFAGVCIPCLQDNEEKCNVDNCKLYHYDQDKFDEELELDSINGVYRFNICPQAKCGNKEICQFFHVSWTSGVCVSNLTKKCKQKAPHDQLKHQTWKNLKDEISKQYLVNNISPENLCTVENCSCDNHLSNVDGICLLYFKGVCPNLNCDLTHVTWEEYKSSGANIKIEKLEPCILINKQAEIKHKPSQIFVKQQELLHLKSEIKEQHRIDIIFIMDCTGSMGPWIEQSSSQIFTLIEKFKKQVTATYTIRVGFVGYRDYNDVNRIEFHDLTCDINRVKQFISLIQVGGGDDEAEDVLSGIQKAYELNISKNPDSILITFLFADAPNHGSQYHTPETGDSYPEIEQGSLENLMQNYQKLKEKNFFYCIKINETTNIMYQIMQKNFGQMFITETAEPQKFPELVRFSLQDSITKSITFTRMLNKTTLKLKADFKKPKTIPYSEGDQKNRTNYWKQFITSINNNLRSGQAEIELETQEMKFKDQEDQGMTCHVFHLKDKKNNRKMLVKIQKKVIEEYNQNKKLSDETIQKANQYAQGRFNSLVIAKQLALIYRQKTKSFFGAPPIFYVSPILYTLHHPFMGLTLLYAETFIDRPNIAWKKYSNNQYFSNPDYYYLTSFSHFTFQETEGLLVVTDLQGKLNILSDPSIQTSEAFNTSLSADSTNLSLEGIASFTESQHTKCNIICNQLGLQQLNNQDGDLDATSFILNQSEQILFICDLCDEFRDISQEEYNGSQVVKCELCQEEEKLLDEVQCQCCKNRFKIPYANKIRIGTILSCCPDCKSQCQQKSNPCNYCEITCKIKVRGFQIDNKQQFICSDARKYLNSLQCQKCKSKYAFDRLLPIDSYMSGTYVCKKCHN